MKVRRKFEENELKKIIIISVLVLMGIIYSFIFFYCNAQASSEFDIENGVLREYKGNKKNVKIPDGVNTIRKYAFAENIKLTSVEIPDSVMTIQGGAFEGCKNLKTISLPESLETIGARAFADCISLQYIKLPNSLLIMGSEAFYNCKSLEQVEIPENDILTDISWKTFMNCKKLSNVKIPSTISSIEEYAFCNTNLKTISLSKEVKNIGNAAFSSCRNLNEIIVDSENENYVSIENVLYSKDKTTLYQYPIKMDTTSFIIPAGTEIIKECAFMNAKNLKTVKIENSVKKIEESAFESCENLNSLSLPSGLIEIEKRSFYKCSSVEKISLPEGLKSMGYSAISHCEKLKKLYIPSTLKIVNGSIDNNKNLKDIILSEGIEVLDIDICGKNMTNIKLPKSLIYFSGVDKDTAWYKSQKAGLVYLDKWLVGYKEDKNHKAKNVTKLMIKEGTLGITDNVFYDMSKLKELTVPSSIICYYGTGEYLEKTEWYYNQPNDVIYLGKVAFCYKNYYYNGMHIFWYIPTKEEKAEADRLAKLESKYKFNKSKTLKFKEGTTMIARCFIKITGVETNPAKWLTKIECADSIAYIDGAAFGDGNAGAYNVKSIKWPSKLKYLRSDSVDTIKKSVLKESLAMLPKKTVVY